MKIPINKKALLCAHLSPAEFLVMLIGYYNLDYRATLNSLIDRKLILPDLQNKDSMVLSDNTRDLITRILLKSDPKVLSSDIDFTDLALRLQSLYPSGIKSGTTYSWRGITYEIEQKLMTLVAVYDFSFTKEEAIQATKEYVESFKENISHMQLLKYFILKSNSKDSQITSMFMTIIENNREK